MNTAEAKIGTGIYTAPDAAKILRIDSRKSRYWFNYYAREKLYDSIGYRYLFNIEDTIAVNFLTLIEMYVFYFLKDEVKMSVRNILKNHKRLSEILNTPYPYAHSNIYASRKKMIFEDSGVPKYTDDLQQTFIEEFILPFYHKITFNDIELAHKFHPLGKNKSIIVDPEHQFGKPVIEGTNIVTETLNDYFEGGDSIEFIANLFDITTENVKDAIEFTHAA